MLSRVADALYWMSRYVERAEHTARVLEVTRQAHIDLAEVHPAGAAQLWNDALGALCLGQVELEPAIWDPNQVGSVANSIHRARENARQVREVVSTEMWNYLNQAYWVLEETRKSRRQQVIASDTTARVLEACFLWGGVTDATMARGTGWLLIRLGQFVERAERTRRIFGVQWGSLPPRAGDDLQTQENVALVNLLRSCGSLEEYQRRHPTRITRRRVAEFVLLEPAYPRTLRYAVSVASDFAKRLAHASSSERAAASARAFGKLAARVEYSELDEVLTTGPAAFTDSVGDDLAQATALLQRAYFLY